MQQIFISYAQDKSHGQHLAEQVHNQLQDAGFAVFRDVSGLVPGTKWAMEIERQLKASQLIVLVVSAKALSSSWVFAEYDMALEQGIPIIPVFAESLSAPLWLRHLHRLDFSRQAVWQDLLKAIDEHIRQPAAIKAPVIDVESDLPQPAWASAVGDDQYGRYADLNVKGVIQRFRWLKPGKFLMGSPLSEVDRGDDEFQHEVTLTQGFWLADTACTQALWLAVMGSNPASFTDSPNNPVERVRWDDVQGFIKKLNSLAAGLHLRLPTEAEWEYACRAGTNTLYSFGNDITKQQVNYFKNVGQTIPVKSLPPNPWGLYEMHGNVCEWCQDWYGEYPAEPVTDPAGAGGDTGLRVVRGGSWFNGGRLCRSASRFWDTPDVRDDNLGCRLALGH